MRILKMRKTRMDRLTKRHAQNVERVKTKITAGDTPS